MANYGTIAGGDTYFGERLNSEVWEDAIPGDRTKALIMATRAIEKLNFAGVKYGGDDQEAQFPRGDDTTVPDDIVYATYECAFAYLDNIDMDLEQENLGVVSDAYSGSRTTYDAGFVKDHIRAGIPSSQAWSYLLPYLRDPREVSISRVS